MDKAGAITRFLERVDRFPQVLLVTDEEIVELFGTHVAAVLSKLERHGEETRSCTECGGDCCRDIGCELYAPEFGQCPIHDVRPIVCRFHFCHRFDSARKELIVGLRDIFLGCFRAVDMWDSPNLRSMDVPPLAEFCPDLVNVAVPIVQAVRQHRLDPQKAQEAIGREARAFREHCRLGTKEEAAGCPET